MNTMFGMRGASPAAFLLHEQTVPAISRKSRAFFMIDQTAAGADEGGSDQGIRFHVCPYVEMLLMRTMVSAKNEAMLSLRPFRIIPRD